MLEINNLTFAYRNRTVVHRLSFSLKAGELLMLRGPNGSGKTTIIAIIAGLLGGYDGTVSYRVHGKPVLPRSIYIEYLSAEKNGLFRQRDAVSNLTFWCALRGVRPVRQVIIDELQHWGLGHPLVRVGLPVMKFSTGMKRRLALARLSLSPARCWIIDEPLNGVDEEGISHFQQVLKRHLANGGMALIASHDELSFDAFHPQVLASETWTRKVANASS